MHECISGRPKHGACMHEMCGLQGLIFFVKDCPCILVILIVDGSHEAENLV
jgi:hypothetical protein